MAESLADRCGISVIETEFSRSQSRLCLDDGVSVRYLFFKPLLSVTAANVGLSTLTVSALALAFVGTATLWWLYFDADRPQFTRRHLASEQAGRLARDAFTYLHIPIVAGIIALAAGDNLLLAHPTRPLSAVGAATVLGGPALFLLGESLFRLRMIGSVTVRRVACVAALAVTAVIARQGLVACAGRRRDRDAGHPRTVRAIRTRTITTTARRRPRMKAHPRSSRGAEPVSG